MTKPLSPPLAVRYPVHLLLFALAFFISIAAGRATVDALSPVVTAPAPAPLSPGDEAYIERLRQYLVQDPTNANAYANLGLALLSQVRLSNDPALYDQAEAAFENALRYEPEHPNALIGVGQLALARHDFEGALAVAEWLAAVAPGQAELWAIRTDAFIELGRYDEAIAAADTLGSTKPGVAAYSRIAYLRELHGNTAGAIEMMSLAARSSVPGSEEMLWTQVQLGHLFFNSGRYDEAEQVYGVVTRLAPDYLHGQAAQARIAIARGDLEAAITIYDRLVARLPLPEFIIALGELYEATGRMDLAQEQYRLVEVMQALNANAGMNVDLELALFHANHGDRARALALARAAYETRPSLYAADALAWALYWNDEFTEAARYSEESLQWGTRDATLFYHAGMIALANGDAERGSRLLRAALAINPMWNVLEARSAMDALR